MLIKEYLRPENIKILNKSNYKECVEILIEMTCNHPEIKNPDEFCELIWDREKKVSTGIGLGLAIPHTRSPMISGMIVSALLIKNGVDWQAIDDQPVNFAVLIASPQKAHKKYLELLSQTVMFWKNHENRDAILQAESAQDIYHLIR
jgi:PTS system nitrogen regulatory IIA component